MGTLGDEARDTMSGKQQARRSLCRRLFLEWTRTLRAICGPMSTRRWPTSFEMIRAGHIRADVWPLGLRERLPTLPVPLRSPDPDVPLDLQAALDTVYDEADYSLTLNYDEPPADPPLSEGDATWVQEQVRNWRALHKGGE